ncbi:MAG TPA: hypothetical protein PK698_06680 [Bacilli bacterium]|nr:hypothetical protein [Bacilli bacterium]
MTYLFFSIQQFIKTLNPITISNTTIADKITKNGFVVNIIL